MNLSENPNRTIKFSDRVSCPHHGPVMVLIRHELSTMGKRWIRRACVTFYRCTAMVNGKQCTYVRPNKYQKREPGERHK